MNESKNINDDSDEKSDQSIIWLLVSVGVLAIIAIITALYYYDSHVTTGIGGLSGVRREEWGQFGDYVGGVLNPLLSFLALVAVLIAVVLQNKELQHSREELKRSSQALEEQSESLRIQNFENTFFQMIRIHNGIVG